MSNKECVPVNQNGDKICVDQTIEIIREYDDIPDNLNSGDRIDIIDIDTNSVPKIIAKTEDDNEIKFSPTLIGEGLGLVNYSDSPDEFLEFVEE